MSRNRTLLRDAIMGIALIGASFGSGWLAFDRHHAETRRLRFDFTPPYVIPREYEPIGLQPSAETACFSAGDRIDVLVSADGAVEPLILDATVSSNTNTNFVVLVPYGGRELFSYAREKGLDILYRPSIVVTDAEFPAAARDAQAEVKRSQAKRQSETGG